MYDHNVAVEYDNQARLATSRATLARALCSGELRGVQGHESGHMSGHESGHMSGHESGHMSGHESGHMSGHESGHMSGHRSADER